MAIRKLVKLGILSGVLVGLVGCAGSGSNSYTSSADNEFTHSSGVNDMASFYGEDITLSQEQELLGKSVVYFDFDQYSLSAEAKLVVLAHAKNLQKTPNLTLRIDGHTDERGSREYNIALGEKRAKAVANLLELKGIGADRVAVVSYGKEKPVELGHDDSSWNLNRRAEINYEG